jgi:FkbM family methyltransferase
MLIRSDEGIYMRKGTYDLEVMKEVKRTFGWLDVEGKRVLDIGAHIGTFSHMAHAKGAKEIWAIEPEYSNYQMLLGNVGSFTKTYNAALVSGDTKEVELYEASYKASTNHSTIPIKGRKAVKVPAVKFGEILEEFQPEVIKMDCEGAEYDLLETTLPESVQEIALEIHLFRKEMVKQGKKLVELFDTWEMVKVPKINTKSSTTHGGWRKKPNSIIKTLGHV